MNGPNVPKMYLVCLNSGDFFVRLDGIANLFRPRPKCAFRDGFCHLRDLDGLRY